MSTISQFLSRIYTTTIISTSILLLELAILVYRAAARITSRQLATTAADEFLETIDRKAPVARYETERGPHEPSECSVCLTLLEEGVEVRKLKCEHTFHKGCVDTWLQMDFATCPLCRAVVLPEEAAIGHRNGRRRREYYGGDDDGDREELMVLYVLHGSLLRNFISL